MKKVFFFDVDDTLLPIEENSKLSPASITALNKLKEAGADVFIATGKSWKMIELVRNELQINNTITSNGQNIRINGKIEFEEYFTYEDILLLEKYLKEKYPDKKLIIGCQEDQKSSVLSQEDEYYQKYVVEIFKDLHVEIPKAVTEIDPKIKIYQFWILGEVEGLEFKDFPLNIKSFRWNKNGIDLLPSDVSKATAIKKVIESKYKNQVIKTYAFGDGFNDIDMLKLVDVSVAMGNAHQEVKDVADYVTEDVQKDGVAIFLKKLHEINQEI